MKGTSFKEYVKSRFYNELYEEFRQYAEQESESLKLYSRIVSRIRSAELDDIHILRVYVGDMPGMDIVFDVAIRADFEISGQSAGAEESDLVNRYFTMRCTGNIEKNLEDFRVTDIIAGDERILHSSPLSDSLVPIIHKDRLDEVASDFLMRNYRGNPAEPGGIDVLALASDMGLAIQYQSLSDDSSVFGLICFDECDIDIYDRDGNKTAVRFPARTILVDPDIFYLRNLGAVNNTIVHECVHYGLHKKAFMFERLFNSSATQIKCRVVGGAKDTDISQVADWMEWQANSLAPRIQMRIDIFSSKAKEFISSFMRGRSDIDTVDVMEPVIDALAEYFCVSRQSAKMRMIDAGYHEAIGAFTYIDGRYVKPHRFRSGAISKSQTYCISLDDWMYSSLTDKRLYEQSCKGAYVFADSHVCLNSPKYIKTDSLGCPELTEYARLHIDECCLAFDLKLTSKSSYAEQYYTECVLFRDINCGLEFSVSFSKSVNGNVTDMADAIIERDTETRNILHEIDLLSFNDALKAVMKYSEITEETLAEESKLHIRMIQRMRNEKGYPKKVEHVVSVCISMHLPPEISFALLGKAGFSLQKNAHQTHVLYDFFLRSKYQSDIEECNEILVSKEFPPLNSGSEL